MSVGLSVNLDNFAPTGRNVRNFGLIIFKKSAKKNESSLNSDNTDLYFA